MESLVRRDSGKVQLRQGGEITFAFIRGQVQIARYVAEQIGFNARAFGRKRNLRARSVKSNQFFRQGGGRGFGHGGRSYGRFAGEGRFLFGLLQLLLGGPAVLSACAG